MRFIMMILFFLTCLHSTGQESNRLKKKQRKNTLEIGVPMLNYNDNLGFINSKGRDLFSLPAFSIKYSRVIFNQFSLAMKSYWFKHSWNIANSSASGSNRYFLLSAYYSKPFRFFVCEELNIQAGINIGFNKGRDVILPLGGDDVATIQNSRIGGGLTLGAKLHTGRFLIGAEFDWMYYSKNEQARGYSGEYPALYRSDLRSLLLMVGVCF